MHSPSLGMTENVHKKFFTISDTPFKERCATLIFYESDPFIHEITMAHDPKCHPPWSDTMPSKLSDFICAKSLNPRSPTSLRTCHGDSGAGLEQRDSYNVSTLIGITSFGSKGCPANELARFTRVSKYLNSICEFTGVCYTIT
uniref:Peptidase S1 domain-containing protein n=2 Tax=Panagrolaimus superbus TaxID=310955 RepID=A0A914YA42_9BILA